MGAGQAGRGSCRHRRRERRRRPVPGQFKVAHPPVRQLCPDRLGHPEDRRQPRAARRRTHDTAGAQARPAADRRARWPGSTPPTESRSGPARPPLLPGSRYRPRRATQHGVRKAVRPLLAPARLLPPHPHGTDASPGPSLRRRCATRRRWAPAAVTTESNTRAGFARTPGPWAQRPPSRAFKTGSFPTHPHSLAARRARGASGAKRIRTILPCRFPARLQGNSCLVLSAWPRGARKGLRSSRG
jgi:hypothetical protein